MKILVATEPVDGRKGIDGLAALCRQKLNEDPLSGCIFVFRTRRGCTVKILVYDGRGYFLAQKRLSQGRFKNWPTGSSPGIHLEAHQIHVLLAAGNFTSVKAAPIWRAVGPGQVQQTGSRIPSR